MIHKVISVDTSRNNGQNATAICQFGDDEVFKFSGRAQIIESLKRETLSWKKQLEKTISWTVSV